MCGIAAIIRTDGALVSEDQLRTMMRTMKHRGPDDDGVFVDGSVGLGFVRLKIIDLSDSGHQPMSSTDGRYTIIFNGEIFNYIELRKELLAKGHVFRTSSDTEVLLTAYIQWGEAMLHRLNGMWAFILFDRQERHVFCARDRYGIKPFYYRTEKDHVIIASEPPAILSVMDGPPEPDQAAIFSYLAFSRTDQNAGSFFKGVSKLPHGHLLRICLSQPTCEPVAWYRLRDELKEPLSGPEDYRELFTSAVDLRLRSDVPVGVCLSGGLDSTSIAATIADQARRADVNTFSAVYGAGRKGDESAYINLFKGRLLNMRYTMPDEHGLLADLDDLTRTQCEPVPSASTYAQYRVMKLAHEHVTVTLDGQGADETLGGYHYFFGFFFKQLLRQGRMLRLLGEMKDYATLHRSAFGFKSLAFFLLPPGLRASARVAEKGYLHADLLRAQAGTAGDVTDGIYGSNSMREALLDHFEHKLEHLLKWADRSSMRFSVEARMPFLDHRLVERTIPMADRWFIHHGMTKHVLREAMRDRIPEAVRMRRDKVGFDTPEAEWFRTAPFRAFILDMLRSERFAARGLVDVQKFERIYDEHLHRRNDRSREIWKLIHLEMWFQHFIDR